MTTSIHDVTKTSLWKEWDALSNVPVGPSIHSGVTLTPHECFGEQNNNFQVLNCLEYSLYTVYKLRLIAETK